MSKETDAIMEYLATRVEATHRQIADATGLTKAKTAKLLGVLKTAEYIHISHLSDGIPHYAVGSTIKEPEKERAMDVITNEYDRGYEDGYKAAISKMKRKLNEISKGK